MLSQWCRLQAQHARYMPRQYWKQQQSLNAFTFATLPNYYYFGTEIYFVFIIRDINSINTTEYNNKAISFITANVYVGFAWSSEISLWHVKLLFQNEGPGFCENSHCAYLLGYVLFFSVYCFPSSTFPFKLRQWGSREMIHVLGKRSLPYNKVLFILHST